MQLAPVGYISKTHGLKGHCILKIQDDIFLDEENLNAVFVDLNGASAPYFVEEITWNNTAYILKLESIDSIDLAKKLVGKSCSVETRFIEEDANPDKQFIGFTVIDEAYGELGPIEEIVENSANVLIRLTYRNKEVLLPFVDELILEIDESAKIIKYKAPEGLIDMFLS
ncbi:MAG: 16S rRNA processing protein RimM [Bacteroidetes bacterium]|nr:16S rRNA processing protein RimM [Bacteroidota bacterium]